MGHALSPFGFVRSAVSALVLSGRRYHIPEQEGGSQLRWFDEALCKDLNRARRPRCYLERSATIWNGLSSPGSFVMETVPSLRFQSSGTAGFTVRNLELSPQGTYSHHSRQMVGYARLIQLAKYLFRKCDQQKWFEAHDQELSDVSTSDHVGVILRAEDGTYYCEPASINNACVRAASHLNASAGLCMRSGAVLELLDQISFEDTHLELGSSGVDLHIVSTVADIANFASGLRLDTCLFLCKKESMIFILVDHHQVLLKRGWYVEDLLIEHIYGNQGLDGYPQTSRTDSRSHTEHSNHRVQDQRRPNTEVLPYVPEAALEDPTMKEKINVIQAALDKEVHGDQLFDPEKEGQEAPKRKLLLRHAVMVSIAMILVVVVEMACIAKMVTEVQLDRNYTRFALLCLVPMFALFSLFFMIVVCGSLWQIFGPLSSLKQNSKYYSAIAPKPGRYPDLELPHITIQMPVYKEGLQGVIIPTITSVMQAVKYYEAQGGSASIFVNDDGMQLVSQDLADARKAYYEINNIGWCARPPHKEKGKKKSWGRKAEKTNDEEAETSTSYFLRKGQFKKASNMNYCLDFSLRVEDQYLAIVDTICQERGCTPEQLDPEEGNRIYQQARDHVVANDNGRTWAAGDVRVGSIILIIDSDTRVPENCLLYGALEMHESPEVALIQHASGIMQVVHNAFENGITYFTNLIYTSISFAVGMGDCAPFVGHNTFIRWDALQSIAWFDEEDKCTKFWSDSHVSEDFDVSLRLQMNNFVVRLATYHEGGFKEGVSLTVYDELARWEKYAYGCNELVFNPLYKWPYKGPITRLFWRFLFSNIKITSKITILAYIGTYYAVASALPLSLANYLIVGWFANEIDQFYLTSWKVWVGMMIVFNVLSPIGYAMLRHRMGKTTFFRSLWDTIKWTPMFLLFFGGVSFHLMKALLCHFFSIKMEWTTTAKEYNGGFRIGLDRIVRDFKWMYLIIIVLTAGMIYLGCFAPYGWTIKDFSAIVPLANQVGCHALLPFALGLF
ncbi:hypothetical protein LTS17_008468 [Exophiala oligosperma]